ncbi:hypothetical protein PC123_g2700 [Phytophthora cactorum]|nr:hypothetical protein PC123_g2700 [Phytophthora cactorum]
MPLPSDVFPALFDALRDRLAVHVSAVDSVTPGDNTPVAWTPLISSSPAASDTLLTSLSTSDPRLHRCIVQEIRHNASASRLEMLRRRRLEVRRTREAKRKHKQRLDAVAAAERDTALLDISTHDHKFQLFVTETHAKATARLQTLFYECIAEIKKALVRMEGVAADTTEESESGRLGLSLRMAIVSSSVAAGLRQGTLARRRITPAHRPPKKSSKLAPSLHFGVSASEMWTEVLKNMVSQSSPSKPQRVISSSSTRRIRRPPSSKDATPPELEPSFSTCDGRCSVFRQLAIGDTPQFPGTACDVQLSSIYIQWMLSTQSQSRDPVPNDVTSGSDWIQHVSVADYNIYFDVAEYEQKFAAIMQNYATSAVSDVASAIDHAVLASARRSLREVSTILERTRAEKKDYSADTIFATRKIQSGDNSSSSQPKDPSIFARASVLQLVQTLYYSRRFLTMLPGVDVAVLRKLYPSALFGEGCITSLYVPVFTCLGESEVKYDQAKAIAPPSRVSMLPLNDRAIHELLLVYVARGRHALKQDSGSSWDSNQQFTSLALSDAVNTLIPSRQTDSKQPAGTRFCVIKNPQGLWKQNNGWKQSKATGEQDDSEELQGFREADVVFVECAVAFTQLGSARQFKAAQNFKSHGMLEILGPSCMWRSCITSQDTQNNTNLCMWHASVQRFIEVGESMQYTPNGSRMKEAMITVGTDSLVERTKRVIQTSSSLLEELSSRHLPYSIKAFYEHVVNATSNHAYQAEFLGETTLAGITNGSTSISDIEKSHHELQRLVDISEEILSTENYATRELQQLLQLTVYPGVEGSFIQHGFFDVEELQNDIRTRDFELLLRLSQQKLQILMRRRQDEDNQVARRLASSRSLPSMSRGTAGLNGSKIGSSVYEVIHVMRKGRQSLLRQQRHQGEGIRNGSKRNAPLSRSLEHCASDLPYRVSPYEVKVVPTAKYRTNDGKRVARKNSNR